MVRVIRIFIKNLELIDRFFSRVEDVGKKLAGDEQTGFLNPENLELDPIEADRFKHEDLALNKSLEELDTFMLNLKLKHSRSTAVRARIGETKSWIVQNRLILTLDQCRLIRNELQAFVDDFYAQE